MYKLDIESAKKDLKIDAEINLDIDEVYKKFTSIKEKLDKALKSKQEVSFSKIEPGIVYEMETDSIPQTVVVLEEKSNTVVVAQMSYMYKLATVYDFIVKIAHPLRDFWIVETDLIIELDKDNFIENFQPVAKLQQNDIKILVSHYKNREELPLNRIGKGTSLPEKIEFKKIELERYKLLFALLLDKVAVIEKAILTESGKQTEVKTPLTEILSDAVKKTNKSLKKFILEFYRKNRLQQPGLAATRIEPISVDSTKFIYNKESNELNIIFSEEFIGDSVDIVLSVKGSEFPLFSLKKAPNMLTVSLSKDDFLSLEIAQCYLRVKKRR